ncbi:hypothetical protein DOT_6191 [Desulfosporosinus sp. OT]|nr:hypothetical protein DOT_6191 [Desulfosporosinus sp. OT]
MLIGLYKYLNNGTKLGFIKEMNYPVLIRKKGGELGKGIISILLSSQKGF